MHALIIEDEPMIALVIEDYLRERGFHSVDIAATEAQAVESGARRCPDLITSDVRLAHGCGIAAVQAICSRHSVPVLFITAIPAEVGDRFPGATVLAKPFTPDDLAAALMRVCGIAFRPRRLNLPLGTSSSRTRA